MNYKPGTVALATVHGVPNVRVFRDSDENCVGWALGERVRNSVWASTDDVTGIRPLPVLRLDAYTEPAAMLRSIADRFTVNAERSLLLNIADEIEAQTKEPRIPEPALFGIVEGWQSGEDRETHLSAFYLREATSGEEDWTRTSDGKRFEWDDIAMPILVREGVEQA